MHAFLSTPEGEDGLSEDRIAGPAFILYRPQLGENIGMVARAMENFSLFDLRLCAPRDGWPNPAAISAAAGAERVLKSVRIYDNLHDACADCCKVYATAMRGPGMLKEVLSPDYAVGECLEFANQGQKSAILFGPERTGLTASEIAYADALVTIATNPDFASLNLAMAVTVFGYCIRQAQTRSTSVRLEGRNLYKANRAELDAFVSNLFAALKARNYFHPDHRAPVMSRNLRTTLQRLNLTRQEVQTLQGVVKTLQQLPYCNPLPGSGKEK